MNKRVLISGADATGCSSAATPAAAGQPFSPEARVDAVVVPRAGHPVSLHRNADDAYRSMIAWTNRNVDASRRLGQAAAQKP